MTKNRKKLVALLSVFMAGLTWSAVVLASSYNLPFAFAHELTSVPRYFDGQNIAFEATPRTYPDSHYPNAQPENSVYTVTLKRSHPWPHGHDTIGKVTLPRTSFGKAVWTNVGPGDYYIFFEKKKDRMIVDDDEAQIYNY